MLADLLAQVAANQRGIALVQELIEQYGLKTIQAYMNYVQPNAEATIREMFKSVGHSLSSKSNELATIEEEDYMDDGFVIHLKLSIDSNKGEAIFDFAGKSAEVYSN